MSHSLCLSDDRDRCEDLVESATQRHEISVLKAGQCAQQRCFARSEYLDGNDTAATCKTERYGACVLSDAPFDQPVFFESVH